MKGNTLLAVAFVVSLAFRCAHRSPAISLGPALPITGTFSNLRYSEQLRGLEGVEIRIVVAGEGYQAAVQFAAGDPSSLIIVPVRFDFEDVRVGEEVEVSEREESRFSFELPEGSPRPGRFSGAITRTNLEGSFVFKAGDRLNVNLQRGKSHWD